MLLSAAFICADLSELSPSPDLNPIEPGFNEYKSFLKLHHHDPDNANHQYMTDRAFTALSPKMHLHFAFCELDSVGYCARCDAERVARTKRNVRTWRSSLRPSACKTCHPSVRACTLDPACKSLATANTTRPPTTHTTTGATTS